MSPILHPTPRLRIWEFAGIAIKWQELFLFFSFLFLKALKLPALNYTSLRIWNILFAFGSGLRSKNIPEDQATLFFSSSCEHQHGRVGKLQYFSGTSACARHGLLLGDAIAGGELAAGESLRVTIGLLVRINKPCLFAHMDLMQTFTTSQCARMSKHAVSLYKLLRVVVYSDDESAVLLLSD